MLQDEKGDYRYSAQPDMDKAPGKKDKKKSKKERKEELEDLKKELEIVSITIIQLATAMSSYFGWYVASTIRTVLMLM